MSTEDRPRVPGSPALTPRLLVGRRRRRAYAELERSEAGTPLPYGYGKTAFRDALRLLGGGPGTNVLLPAYVPDGVVAAIRDAGARPRFYAIERDLGPDLADVREKLDDRTAAATFVHYFGFPGERFDAFRRAAAERGVPVVADNAHAAFSAAGDRRLGTRGTIGFTSLRKTLPVPNGALLFVDGPDRLDGCEAVLSGTADSITAADCRFALASLSSGTTRRHPAVERARGAVRRLRDGATAGEDVGEGEPTRDRERDGERGGERKGEREEERERDPEAIYRRARVPMSRLTARVLARVDPETVAANRRDAYRAWRAGLSDVTGVELRFDDLPRGVSPQVVPVVADDPEGFLAALDRRGVAGAHTWPPLPAAVSGNDAYPTANSLAANLVALPCHQDVDPGAVHAVCAGLRADGD